MATTARAAIVESAGRPFALAQVELDEPRPDEVLVAIGACGVCHTDLSVRDGLRATPLPAVLGHEGAGVVERVGATVRSVKAGDRVAMSFAACGVCPSCATAVPGHCHAFRRLNFAAVRADGSTAIARQGRPVHSHFFGQSAFATRAVALERSLVKLPDDIPLHLAAPLGCGIQTGAGTVINALRPLAGSSIAIFGVGGVGMAAVMAARIVGCAAIVAVDVNPVRLELARELGATHAIDGSAADPVAEIRAITGAGAEDAAEASGAGAALLRQAVESTAPLGVTAVVGSAPPGDEVALEISELLLTGRVVRGVVEGHSVPRFFIPRLIELWRQGRLPVDRLVTTFAFDDIAAAVRGAERGEVIKPVLVMGEPG